tara:strand:+ start:1056 stop:1730 length:675 start_codon:yes stop_codon:yes gene_type:complete
VLFYHDDCLELIKTFPDDHVDHVLTSPPYNIGRSKNTKSLQKAKYSGFEDKNKNYFEWSVQVIDELRRVTKGNVFYNIQANYYNKKDVYKLMGHYHKDLIQSFIWIKGHTAPASEPYAISNFYEYIWAFSKNSRIKGNEKYNKNIIQTDLGGRHKGFHAVMHDDVADFFIQNFTKEGEVILDPFLGSGTTGVSCLKNNRDFIGIELVEEYYFKAQQRIEDSFFK